MDILWQVFCEDPDGTTGDPFTGTAVTDRLAGDFADGAAPPGPNGIIIPLDDATDPPVAQATAEAGIAYRVTLDVQ